MSSHPVDMHVGSKLKSRRIMLGMSQDELGKAVGVTFQQVQKYEKGLNRIGCSRLYEISNVLNSPISFFFDGFESSNNKTNPGVNSEQQSFKHKDKDELNNKEVLLLVRAFNGINNHSVRKHIISLIKSIANEEGLEEA
jgi:transcriptional regulator with XRE-family HTH domain